VTLLRGARSSARRLETRLGHASAIPFVGFGMPPLSRLMSQCAAGGTHGACYGSYGRGGQWGAGGPKAGSVPRERGRCSCSCHAAPAADGVTHTLTVESDRGVA
jgi:hypothetical protein